MLLPVDLVLILSLLLHRLLSWLSGYMFSGDL